MINKTILLIALLIGGFCSHSQVMTDCFSGFKLKKDSIRSLDSVSFEKLQNDFKTRVIGCKAPDFKIVNMDGDTVELKKLAGKVVVVNFWFKTCPICIAEMPALNMLVDEYRSKDVVFLGLCRDNKEYITQNFLGKFSFNFTIFPDCKAIADKYRVYFGYPETFVIDRKQIVRFINYGGPVDESAKTDAYYKLKPEIDKCLK
jgi:peroxiredoxin